MYRSNSDNKPGNKSEEFGRVTLRNYPNVQLIFYRSEQPKLPDFGEFGLGNLKEIRRIREEFKKFERTLMVVEADGRIDNAFGEIYVHFIKDAPQEQLYESYESQMEFVARDFEKRFALALEKKYRKGTPKKTKILLH